MAATLPALRPAGSQVLDKLLREKVALKQSPAIFFLATNAKETIYENQEGERVFGNSQAGQVDPDTVLELFSQSKLITAIAVLQLVDRGFVSLDSEDDVAKYLHEIQEVQLLTGYEDDGRPILVKPKNRITLRMLLAHTSGAYGQDFADSAGFAYPFLPTILTPYFKLNPDDTDGLQSTASMSTICKPLVHEPGTSWSYGTGSDFAGKLVERVTGLRLDEYFQRHIFHPLGLTSMTFFPTDRLKKNKMAMCVRAAGNKVRALPTGFGLRPTEADKVSTKLLSAGAGLFGTQREFLAILRAILQSDPSSPHRSDKPLISPQSYKELFTGCVDTQAGRQGIVDLVGPDDCFDPPATSENVDYSIGFALNLEDFPGRRKRGSGSWYGAAHTQYWIDPSTGIAGICATQLFAFSPDMWYGIYVEYEKALYGQLELGDSGSFRQSKL